MVNTTIQTNKEANDILNVSVKYTVKVNIVTREKHDAIWAHCCGDECL